MKFFPGWLLAAGLALTATAASAQMGPSRVSDFSGPYVEGPYRGPQYAPPPVEVVPPPRYGYGPGPGYGYGPGYAPAALVPPHEVYNIIREAGFSPLGIPRQRGFIYTIAVIDRGGEDGRLVIDARSGRILRFVPAWQNGSPYDGAWNSSYGPPGPLPPAPGLRSGMTPPAAPQVASRSVPVPKPSPLAGRPAVEAAKPAEATAAKPAVEAAAKPAVELVKPATEAEKPVSPPSTQQAAATPAKPADTAPATATIGQTQAKPAPSIQPTQDMPKAQGLE
jgi:hypothetical protein